MYQLSFDHVHILSENPGKTAKWYEEMLGGEIVESTEVLGAPQIYIRFGASMVIIRGQRPNEIDISQRGVQGIVDHFAFRVDDDFDGLCRNLKSRGVEFTMQPSALGKNTSAAFIRAPDGVSIELMHRT